MFLFMLDSASEHTTLSLTQFTDTPPGGECYLPHSAPLWNRGSDQTVRHGPGDPCSSMVKPQTRYITTDIEYDLYSRSIVKQMVQKKEVCSHHTYNKNTSTRGNNCLFGFENVKNSLPRKKTIVRSNFLLEYF